MRRLHTADPGHHGAVSWVDLSTPDADSATRFYADLFGWTVATSTTPMGTYHIASVDGTEVCGMMGHPAELAGSPATWTVFFTVGDLDATLASIADHDGAVLQPPIAIPDGARVAVAADPAGAMFALISGGPRPHGTYLSATPGACGWVEVLTRDPPAIVPFYETIFGWDTDADPATGYTTFTLDGATVGGMLAMPPEVPAEAPSHWAVYFTVADAVATEQHCGNLGGSVHRRTTSVGGVRFAVLADPQGAMFDVIEFAVPSPG